MENKTNRKFIYAGGLPVVLLSSVVIWNSVQSDPYECYGMIEGLGYMFVGGILLLLFAITLLVQIVRMFDNPEWIARVSMLLLAFTFLSIALFTMSQPRDYFKAEAILEASFTDTFKGGLILHEDGMFSANEEYADWSCTTYGSYHENGDTIFLLTEVVERSHGLFSDRYLKVDNRYLIPIFNNVATQDTSEWLYILHN
jgi:hypothetical protein